MDEDFHEPDIDSYLQGSLNAFEHEVQNRYQAPDADAIWNLANRVAELLRNDAEALVKSDGTGWERFRAVTSSHPLWDEFQYALQSQLAWSLMPSFQDAARRCWELAEVAKKSVPTEQVESFLGRVVRCYLLGLDPECLVMCRGAFENSLNARFIAEGVEFPGNPMIPSSKPMKLRIQTAEEHGWLPKNSSTELYQKVHLRGSKAAHADPKAVGAALEAIKLTATALASLQPPNVEAED